MTLEQRTQALLEVVAAERARQCGAIADAAKADASALLAQARAEARANLRRAFAEERERSGAVVSAARARQRTRHRLADQRRVATFLAIGMEKLALELLRLWHDSSARRNWVSALTTQALALLPHGSWLVVHPADWPAVEQTALSSAVASALSLPPRFVADGRIRAGLRITEAGNSIDGTYDGLLADRAEVGARLLAAIEAAT